MEYGFRCCVRPLFYSTLLTHLLLHQAEALLVDPNVFGVNVTDITEAKRLLKDRTPLDRLPESSLEGLELLKDCWNEVDVAVHTSKRYMNKFVWESVLVPMLAA